MVGKGYIIEPGTGGEFARLLAVPGEFGELWKKGGQELFLFPYILQDIFYALYHENPVMAPVDKTSTGARLNRLLIDQLKKSWEFRRARGFTRQNLTGAAMVALYFAQMVLTGLNAGIIETANEIFTSEEELRDALLQRKVADKIAGVAEDEALPDAAGLYRAEVEQWDFFIEDKRKNLRALAARLMVQWNTSGRKGLGQSGADTPKDQQGRFATGAEGVGDRKGVWTRGDISQHLKMVEQYTGSAKLKRLAERVGRLREVKTHRRGENQMEDAAEVTGVTYGNDLTLVVPEEWADFFAPSRSKGFLKKYADENLCLYDMTGKRRREKGSMIVCLDNSGSMQGPKEETGKAITLALMEIAASQKRDIVVIMFGGPDDEMKKFEFPQGQVGPEQLIEVGEHFLCSAGTDFEKPLKQAVQYIGKDKYPGGDIIFITDGVCGVSPEFLEKYRASKKTRKFKTTVVLVNYGQVSTAPVESFADDLLSSKDLKGLDVAGQLFASVRAR